MGFLASGLALFVLVTMSHFQEGAASVPICLKGWIYSSGYCYGYFSKPLTWYEAELRCQEYSQTGHLVSIANKQILVVVIEVLISHGSFSAYIGLLTAHQGSVWWSDDSKANYQIWGPGQPNYSGNLDYYCGQLVYSKGSWYYEIVNCYVVHTYICRYQA